MTNKCETYILNRSGKWIREDDWFWPTVSEDERLDEEDNLEGELSLDERRAIANPLSGAAQGIGNIAAEMYRSARDYVTCADIVEEGNRLTDGYSR
ncbi:hypothetical protein JW898_02430 [Candidatus Woesearchaeota archaeon]|nr:hypothetical protein [Candidatus Woesearchaeota archaeon]